MLRCGRVELVFKAGTKAGGAAPEASRSKQTLGVEPTPVATVLPQQEGRPLSHLHSQFSMGYRDFELSRRSGRMRVGATNCTAEQRTVRSMLYHGMGRLL